MSDRVVSYLRTAVPVAWGWLLTQLAAVLPGPLADALGTPEAKAAVTAGAIFVWYALWRWLEPRIPDWLTRLVLGSAKPPAYRAGVVHRIELGPVGVSADGTPLYTEDRIRLDDVVHLALDAEHQAGRLPDDVDQLDLAARITDAIAAEMPAAAAAGVATADAPDTMTVAADERQWLLDTRKVEGRDPLTGASEPSALEDT